MSRTAFTQTGIYYDFYNPRMSLFTQEFIVSFEYIYVLLSLVTFTYFSQWISFIYGHGVVHVCELCSMCLLSQLGAHMSRHAPVFNAVLPGHDAQSQED